MIGKFLDNLMVWMNRKEILKNPDQQPYLIRYYIYGGKNSFRKYRGRGLYLQKLIDSNYYNHPHDYPWRWGRFILKGQLIELIRNHNNRINVIKIKRFNFTPFISSRFSHTQKLVKHQPVWMLFWHGKYKNRWGYWMNNEKIYYRDYYRLINKNETAREQEITENIV